MKKSRVFIINILVLLLTILFMSGFSYSGLAKILNEDELISIVKDYAQPQIIFVASREHVYKSIDTGKNWEKIFSARKANKKINRLYCSRQQRVLYVLTQDGLFMSDDQGDNWKRSFRGNSDLENNCLSLLSTSGAIYLGTEERLLISHDQGKTWQRSLDQFSDSVVSSIAGTENIIYVASERGVFISEDNGKNWRRIYVVYSSEIPEEDYNDYEGETSNQVLNIRSMIFSNNKLYIATTKGLFFTEDKGERWKSIAKTGLPTLDIRSMVVSKIDGTLYVVLNKGIFKLESNRWKRIGAGALYKEFNDLDIGETGVMFIAGRGGLYKLSSKEDELKAEDINYCKEDIENLFVGEPTIEQVQEAAMRYSETNINKIYSWRRQARWKALLPSISIGYDKTIYGSYTDRFAVGPRDWDLNFSWDVSDLIWSTDQTSIDSRSRLTVQLRQDILDQITSLYYERQRLKVEFLLSPPTDEIEKLYRTLEIQQVTANIDALTNNFFSRFLQKKKQIL